MAVRKGMIDISEDVLDGGSKVEAMGKGPATGIVAVVVVIIAVHEEMMVVTEQGVEYGVRQVCGACGECGGAQSDDV